MERAATDFRRSRRRVVLPLVVGITVFVLQLSGQYGAGLGYALLLVSVVLLTGGVAALGLLVFTRKFSAETLTGAMRWLFLVGAWMYVIGVFDLSGHFVMEGLAGRVEMKWLLFGPTALAALALFDIGMYRILYQKNRPSWDRYHRYISRENAEPALMRKTFLEDVVMHSSLISVSGFRWLRHTLIFWGFALLFGVEVIAVFIREGIPAFGYADIWEIAGHPVRVAFDFAFDFFGFLVLVGCLLSFIWRIRVGKSEEKKFADTPSVLFLFFVVVTGFVVEAARLVIDGFPAGSCYSFVGWTIARMTSESGHVLVALHTPMWYFHVFGSLAFIAYVPVFRLVHSCATPIGRMMNSQKRILANKRMHSLSGLLSSMSKNDHKS